MANFYATIDPFRESTSTYVLSLSKANRDRVGKVISRLKLEEKVEHDCTDIAFFVGLGRHFHRQSGFLERSCEFAKSDARVKRKKEIERENGKLFFMQHGRKCTMILFDSLNEYE